MQKVFRRRLRSSEDWKQWFEQQKTRACVPHTPYTSVLKFVSPVGRVSGAATHAVGGNAGYGLLHLVFKGLCHPQVVCGVTTHAVGGDAGYGLLETRAQERPSDHAPVIAEFDC